MRFAVIAKMSKGALNCRMPTVSATARNNTLITFAGLVCSMSFLPKWLRVKIARVCTP